jgi:hypothetical protein
MSTIKSLLHGTPQEDSLQNIVAKRDAFSPEELLEMEMEKDAIDYAKEARKSWEYTNNIETRWNDSTFNKYDAAYNLKLSSQNKGFFEGKWGDTMKLSDSYSYDEEIVLDENNIGDFGYTPEDRDYTELLGTTARVITLPVQLAEGKTVSGDIELTWRRDPVNLARNKKKIGEPISTIAEIDLENDSVGEMLKDAKVFGEANRKTWDLMKAFERSGDEYGFFDAVTAARELRNSAYTEGVLSGKWLGEWGPLMYSTGRYHHDQNIVLTAENLVDFGYSTDDAETQELIGTTAKVHTLPVVVLDQEDYPGTLELSKQKDSKRLERR